MDKWIRYTTILQPGTVQDAHANVADIKCPKGNYLLLLPYLNDDDNSDELEEEEEAYIGLNRTWVYKSAMASILDFGIQQWKTCEDAVRLNIIPMHGNKK